MLRFSLPASVAFALVAQIAGCKQTPASTTPREMVSAQPSDQATMAVSVAPLADGIDQPSFSRDPVEVLDGWTSAIELRDWRSVRAYWGDHGARNGMDDAAFAAKWNVLKEPVVTIGPGAQEGGAGSLYYTAPVTIVDGKRTLRGEVTIRRVNDVPGASTEQLRWHVETLTLPL